MWIQTRLAVMAIVVAALVSCSNSTSPVSTISPPPLFAPLEMGDQWVYRVAVQVRAEADNETTILVDGTGTMTRTIIEEKTLQDRLYSVMEEIVTADGGGRTGTKHFNFRQDDSGLMEGIVDSEDMVFELRHLQYPLDVGSEWILSEAQATTASVEAKETIELSIGSVETYRVRVVKGSHGPNDAIFYWYSECGLVAFDLHEETIAIDVTDPGNTVVIVSEASQELSALQVDKSGCGDGP